MLVDSLYKLFLDSGERVFTDTRKISPDDRGLFFALSGENFNGNRFASQALDIGCTYAVIDDPAYDLGERTILVDNCLESLQQLAAHHRKQMSTTIIAITGSNGKTTTKELLAAVMKTQYKVIATQGNYNNHIGVPLTLLSITSEHDYAIVEIGTNSPGEIGFLSEFVDPDYGLITSIGKAHLERLGSVAGVAEEKLSLFDNLRSKGATLFFQETNQWMIDYFHDKPYDNTIAYDARKGPGYSIDIEDQFPTISGIVQGKNMQVRLDSELFGQHNILNISAAICVASHFQIPLGSSVEAINTLRLTNNRTQRINWKEASIYLDAYNANPSSMTEVIRSFSESDVAGKWVILGDMFELGLNEIEEHQSIINLLQKSTWDEVILVGSLFAQTTMPSGFKHFEDFAACYAWFSSENIDHKHILIKASRGMALERLLE